jgi:ribosomal protein S18 acetylase RimI-like enzyme
VKIVHFEDRFASDFERLNRAWLEGYGLLEPQDVKYLDAPRETIIDPGGSILMAVENDRVIGTCAVIPVAPRVVELAKLAVVPEAQRRGIGRRLTIAAIDSAVVLGAERMILVSNNRLVAAVRLYESLGFKHAPLPVNLAYATANVYMELEIGKVAGKG